MPSSGTVINSTSASQLVLTATSQNPVTVTQTGTIDVNSANSFVSAIYGSTVAVWTITNYGVLESVGPDGQGIALNGNGVITNEAGGLIAGSGDGISLNSTGTATTITNFGNIESTAAATGTYANFGVIQTGGTVANYGTISALPTASRDIGVQINNGGLVVNGAGGAVTALISGGEGVALSGGNDTLINYGTITGAFYPGVNAFNGADVQITNLGTISGLGTHGGGVNLNGGGVTGSLVNGQSGSTSGIISGTQNGVYFGTSVTTGTLTNYGTIEQVGTSGFGTGVTWNVGAGTIRNLGTISEQSPSGAAVALGGTAGSTLINGQSGSASGVVTGYSEGVSWEGIGNAPSTVINYGEIEGTETATGSSTIYSFGVIETGTVENFGTIVDTAAGQNAISVQLNNGGEIVNGSTSATTALISGGEGIAFVGGSNTLVNYGTITATLDPGVNAFGGAGLQVTNFGLISAQGTNAAGASLGNGGSLLNRGVIAATGSNATAVVIDSGGSLVNGQSGSTSGTISGSITGVYLGSSSNAGTLTNYGTIAQLGSAQFGIGVNFHESGTIRNLGTISEQNSSGAAVSFGGTAGSTLINGQSGSASGVITGYQDGVSGSTPGTAPNTVINYGEIEGTKTATGSSTIDSFGVIETGTVENFGTIVDNAAGQNAIGVQLNNGGKIVNGSATDTAATISGGGEGVAFDGGTGSLTNYGTIKASTETGVNVFDGASAYIRNFGLIGAAGNAVDIGTIAGTVINYGTMASYTASHGALFLGAGGTVTNTGMISATGTSSADISFGAGVAGTVVNSGTLVASTGSTSGIAVYLRSGGAVTNNQTGLINASREDVSIIGAAGTVLNRGTIESAAAGTSGEAIYLGAGGTVTNYGLISGNRIPVTATYSGVITTGLDIAVVRNYGTISTTNLGNGVNLLHGGTIVNGSAAATGATITGSHNGVYAGGRSSVGAYPNGAAAYITNYGTVQTTGTGSAIHLVDGGAVTNAASGLILSVNGSAISTVNAAVTVVNRGTIESTVTGTNGQAMYIGGGGTVTNYGLITGARPPVTASYTGVISTAIDTATIRNFGTISSNSTNVSNAINLLHGGTIVNGSTAALQATITGKQNAIYAGGRNGAYANGAAAFITNYGTVQSTGTGSVIRIVGGGTVTNEATGLILGYGSGVNTSDAPLTVANYGTVTNTGNHAAVYLGAGGSVTNGSIAGTAAKIYSALQNGFGAKNAAATITNFATVGSAATVTGTAGSGVYLQDGGSITNEATGVISANRDGVTLGGTVATSGNATVTNFGDITGYLGVVVNALDTGANTVVNYGTIVGTGGTAVQLSGTATTLAIEPGSMLSGAVSGFALGDTIDFAHKVGNSATLANGVLSLTNAGTVVGTVALSGTLAGNFTVTSDNAGGTDVALSGSPGLVIAGTYTNTVSLTSPSQNPVTVTKNGLVDVNSANSFVSAIYGSNAAIWTITNFGTLESFGPDGVGIDLTGSGVITNEATGLIAGSGDGIDPAGAATTIVNFGTIESTATATGTYLNFGVVQTGGTVENYGTISALPTAQADIGVEMFGGGRVVNGASGAVTALISGGGEGVAFDGGNGTLVNYGTISAALGVAVNAFGGPGPQISNFGTITAAGTNASGVSLANGGTLLNVGTIAATGTGAAGVSINGGGSLVNGHSGSTAGVISGTQNGVYFGTSVTTGTLTNYGSIEQVGSAGFGAGVTWNVAGGTIRNLGTISEQSTNGAAVNFGTAGGTLINGQSGSNTGTISGYQNGVGDTLGSAPDTIVNYGEIQSTATASSTIFPLGVIATGTVRNFGTIATAAAGQNDAGVQIDNGGSVVNGASGSVTALISGGGAGVAFNGGSGTLVNYGTITAALGPAVHAFFGAVVQVTNQGTITGQGTSGSGVTLDPGSVGGSLVNGHSGSTAGVISGTQNGVYFGTSVTNGTLTNFGTIGQVGSTEFDTGVTWNAGPGTIRNLGTISEQSASGAAVNFGTAGGTLINGQSGSNAGTIAGYQDGISGGIPGSTPNTIVNYGDIVSTETATGSSTIFAFGIVDTGTVDNYGSISAAAGTNGTGVQLNNGGLIVNGGSGATTATISAANNGVAFNGGSGTLVNYGTIKASVGTGVNVFNGAAAYIENFGLIGAAGNAVSVGTVAATVINYGTVASYTASHAAVFLGAGGTVTNTGKISAEGTSSADISFGAGAAGTVVNSGTLVVASGSVNGVGVYLRSGGLVINAAGGLINASHTGIAIIGAAGTVINGGMIRSTAPASGTTGSGVYLLDGGIIANGTYGTITGDRRAISIGGTVATSGNTTLANFGDIGGNVGVSINALDTGTNTIVNYGTIAGTGGTAIQLSGTATTLAIEPGSLLSGALAGFAIGDTIDFAEEVGNSAVLSNGTLSLMNGTAVVASVALAGAFGSDTFTVSSDNAGGTDVQLSPAAPTGNELSGDGTADALMMSSTGALVLDEVSGGSMGYTQVSGIGSEWQSVGEGPLLGDGKDQVLLWYGTDDSPIYGSLVVGEDDGGSLQYTQIGAIGPEWQFEGVGVPTDGSQGAFLLWDGSSSSPSYGALVLGQVSGGQATYAQIGAVGPEWHFEGVGNFLGGTNPDFVIWDTSSSSPSYGSVVVGQDVNGAAQYTLVGGLDPTAWIFEGSGDLLNDGKDSFLIWNQNTGALVVGEVNGSNSLQYTQIGAVGPEWQFLGVGDYDGKSPAEFLMFNVGGSNSAGALVLGTVSGGVANYTQVGGVDPSQWTFHLASPALQT